jgi:DNA-binding CsgD family transcriptional regulator
VIVPLEGVGAHHGSRADTQYALSLLRDVDDMPKLYEAIKYLARYSDAAGFSFVARYPSAAGSTLVVVTDLPRRWTELYERRHYDEIDPIAIHCRARLTPIMWWQSAGGGAGDARSFVEEARRFGMCSGASFPLHGLRGARGALTISYRRDLEETKSRLERCIPYIQLLSAYVFEAAARAIGPQQHWAEQGMTRREMECLSWCSEGKTSWEIAKILGITERTVHFHMQNASHKLGASSRSHAVRLAMQQIAGPAPAQPPARRAIRMWGMDDLCEQVDLLAENDRYPANAEGAAD